MKEEWDFLDNFDGNILFTYMQGFKNNKRVCFTIPYSAQSTGNAELDELNKAMQKRKFAYYLFWFVFRYVLNCKTLEEALFYANEETLKKYNLSTVLYSAGSGKIYIGVYGNEVFLYKPEDIKVILEILYNRYDFFEQLECFLRHNSHEAGNRMKGKRNRCLKALEQGKALLEEKGIR